MNRVVINEYSKMAAGRDAPIYSWAKDSL